MHRFPTQFCHHWGWPCLRWDVVSFGEVTVRLRPGPGQEKAPEQLSSHCKWPGCWDFLLVVGISSWSLSKGNDKPDVGTLENTEVTWDMATTVPGTQAKPQDSFWL